MGEIDNLYTLVLIGIGSIVILALIGVGSYFLSFKLRALSNSKNQH